ncbi:CaCA family Na+/Ca+ antiporter [Methanobacterium formicicum]|uniref:CaCA family Na+/Ca+ antiporter n=1 Tax=Methanobacterium formicicum TaxID=2162 RepID=A0A090I5H4_METFO|nr:CaCA family Na+/Ca+ antiporter [Methanobacterium formicicum]
MALMVLLVICLVIVIKSADIFVDNLVEIGLVLGISEIILGVTASAIGTSLPEFGSAMIAILGGNHDIGIGCAIGANIWNMSGIIGISAIFSGVITTSAPEVNRDGLMALITALTLMVSLFVIQNMSFVFGILMVAMYLVYLGVLIRAQKNNESSQMECCEIKEEVKEKSLSIKPFLLAFAGLFGLAIGCRVIVYCTIGISEITSIPSALVGIFLALGTTAPEFFTVLSSAKKGLNSLAVGTVFGSNIFNILIGLGIPSLFVLIPVDPVAIYFDVPVMVCITLLLLFLIKRGMKLTRVDGTILIASYIFYILIRVFFF